MSNNRRQYRQAQREYEKKRRVIDWHKAGKQLKVFAKLIPVIGISCFTIMFAVNYFGVNSRNSKRQQVAENPVTTNAVVKKIYTSRRSRGGAVFVFEAGGISFTGETFDNYTGSVGDSICVIYNAANPHQNIYCEDIAKETFKNDVLISSAWSAALTTAAFIVFLPLVFLYQLILGDKQTLSSFTSKKNR